MSQPFLSRTVWPEPAAPFNLADLAKRWNDPVDAAERVVEFDRWSLAFDAGHPLNRAERDVQLMVNANLSDEEIIRVSDQIQDNRNDLEGDVG